MRPPDEAQDAGGRPGSTRTGRRAALRLQQQDGTQARSGGSWQRGAVEDHGAVAWRLPVKPGSVRVARRLVHLMCRSWRIPQASESAVLAVSELVGNVARAGGTDVRLCLSWTPRRLRVEVCDAVPGIPRAPRRVAASDERGRGLWLVSQHATRWGSEPTPRGKCVWAEFAL